ncbi:MAG: glutaminyl-peptide cyclotransferase [Pseudomonadales bacterium]|nr:glutaminyl-peptide cyclotransferase [Pseudomonadales bacterium]
MLSRPITVACLAALAVGTGVPAASAVESLTVRVQRVIPHETDASTQGLVWWRGKLYESTGRRGHSELRRIDPTTGEVERRLPISKLFFGEGLAQAGDRLVMLTWHAEQAFVFGIRDFDRRGTFGYRGEGWGLCHDGEVFVMSDGSDRLAFRDSDSFAVVGSVGVTLDGRPVRRLNALECVAGEVYANVYRQDVIVRIDPTSGRVTGRIDASGLLGPEEAVRADVLNGIAHVAETDRFLVTGKLWPKMFEVTFVAEASGR